MNQSREIGKDLDKNRVVGSMSQFVGTFNIKKN